MHTIRTSKCTTIIKKPSQLFFFGFIIQEGGLSATLKLSTNKLQVTVYPRWDSPGYTFHLIGTYLHLPRVWYNNVRLFMHISPTDKLIQLAAIRQFARPRSSRRVRLPRSSLGPRVPKD